MKLCFNIITKIKHQLDSHQSRMITRKKLTELTKELKKLRKPLQEDTETIANIWKSTRRYLT